VDCGHPLPADASFCANCGRTVEPPDEAEQPASEDTMFHAADQQEG